MDAQIPPDHDNANSAPQLVAPAVGDDPGEAAYLLRQVVAWITDVALHAPSKSERGHDA